MVRLVATDLDGTLLSPDGAVSDRSIAAAQRARAAGIHVVPVTGRRPQSTWRLAEIAGLGPLGVCANGAVVTELDGSRDVLEVVTLAGEVALGAVALLRNMLPDVRLGAFGLERLMFEPGYFDEPVLLPDSVEEVPDIGSEVAGGCVQLTARMPGWASAKLLEVLAPWSGERLQVTSSGRDSVDIGAPGVSKAYALERVCERLGVTPAEVIAIGDNYNDLSALGWAGQAMAPANAIGEVLAIVDRVLPSNAEDGVAQLLEELVAGRL